MRPELWPPLCAGCCHAHGMAGRRLLGAHDAIATDAEGIAHALLVAVLIKLGGSIDLDETDLAHDAMGDQEGRLYKVKLSR